MPLGRVLALAVVVGTTVGTVTSIAASAAWAAALAAASLAVVIDSQRDQRVLTRALVVLCLGAAAAGHAARARDRVLAPPLLSWLADEEREGRRVGPALLDGVLARDAEPLDAGARLLIDVHAIGGPAGSRPVRGRVQVHVAGQLVGGVIAEWSAGRRLRAPVTLQRPSVSVNPGGRSVRWQTLTRRFDLVGSIKSAVLVSVSRGRPWDESAARVRGYVRRATSRLFGRQAPQVGAVVNAILIGDRAGLDEDVERRLQVAGTYHVIAISGGNVALLTIGSFLVLRTIIRSFRWTSLATMALVTSYGWVVGGDPSVSRAVTAASIYLACGVFGLVPAALDVLALVALVVAIADPLTVVDAGAWLSFGATLGIIVAARRWEPAPSRRPSLRHRLGRAALGLFGATLAAELALLPVGAAVFTRVSVAGLVLNFIAIPMMTVVQVAGAVAVMVVAWWERAGVGAGSVAEIAARALMASARVVDVVPWLSWRVPPPSTPAVICYYATALCCLHAYRSRRWRRVVITLFGVSLAVIACAPGTWRARPPRGWMRLTMFDVGQGESLLLQSPSGHALLVDAGGRSARFDVGDRVVTPALWASGVRALDLLAFSHADLDHIGGAASVVHTFGPREIWEGVPVTSDPERAALVASVADRRLWRQTQRGDRIQFGSVDIEALNPAPPEWERQRVRNDDSIVLRVRYGDVEFLLTGDIGAEIERSLVISDRVPLRVLKVAHHGSRTSSSAEFLRDYAPHLAIVSAGRGNPFGHPSRDVVDRLTAVGARVFRTDLDGAVIVETDGHEVRVRSMTGRAWTMRVSRQPA